MNARALRGLVIPVLLLAIWFVATHYGLVNAFIVVRPDKVAATAIEHWREGLLLAPLLASLGRDLLGFALGTFAGLSLGGAMGMSNLADRPTTSMKRCTWATGSSSCSRGPVEFARLRRSTCPTRARATTRA
jgi:ABC-type nitrate/sulfonate/bicarbonate transport system permease component